jgi:hypothetical protein
LNRKANIIAREWKVEKNRAQKTHWEMVIVVVHIIASLFSANLELAPK